MFLWWSSNSKKTATPQANAELAQREIDSLAEELASATLARPSPVSKARYNKWAVVESNRQVGDQMRNDGDGLNSQRRSMRSQFLQEGNQRAQTAREQREAAAERVRQYREYNASRGAQGKANQQESKRMTEEQKAAWQEHGAQTALVQGVEQRERVIESRAEREEARRVAAVQHKQGAAERAADFHEATKKQIMEKRSRVARIRAETQPEVAAASKQHFFSRRKGVADDVRQSVRDWRVEQQYRKEEALARAREHHDMAVSAQTGAIDQQIFLQEARRQQASMMRGDIKSIEQRKEMARLSQEMVCARRLVSAHARARPMLLGASPIPLTARVAWYDYRAAREKTDPPCLSVCALVRPLCCAYRRSVGCTTRRTRGDSSSRMLPNWWPVAHTTRLPTSIARICLRSTWRTVVSLQVIGSVSSDPPRRGCTMASSTGSLERLPPPSWMLEQ